MKNIFLFILAGLIFNPINIYSQSNDFSNEWKNKLINDEYFSSVNLNDFLYLNLSPAITNIDTFSFNYLLETYTGVFGPLYRRIDFFINVTQDKNDKKLYHVVGKNKLNLNIRPIKGELKLLEIRKQYIIPSYKYLHLAVFEYHFKEPGTKSGDGEFTGIASILFSIENSTAKWFLSDGGDFDYYSNVFVGTWKKYQSNKQLKCIFSYDVISAYAKLPFCDEFYVLANPEYQHEYILNKKYYPYGWDDYYKENKQQDIWWK